MSLSKNAKKSTAAVKPSYIKTLQPVVKARYVEKMKSIGNFDPYEVVCKKWSNDEKRLHQLVTKTSWIIFWSGKGPTPNRSSRQ